jgi:hypothetical protein
VVRPARLGTVTSQDIKTWHTQQVVNAAPTAGEGAWVAGMISALVGAGIEGGYLANPRLAKVHWQAAGRPRPTAQVTMAGESVLWVDPAQIPAGQHRQARPGARRRAARGPRQANGQHRRLQLAALGRADRAERRPGRHRRQGNHGGPKGHRGCRSPTHRGPQGPQVSQDDLSARHPGRLPAGRAAFPVGGFSPQPNPLVGVRREQLLGHEQLILQVRGTVTAIPASHELQDADHVEDALSRELRRESGQHVERGRLVVGIDVLPADRDMRVPARHSPIDDERAASCREALAGRRRDLQRALSVATGSPAAQPDGEVGRLRSISQLAVPAKQQVGTVATGLRAAADALAEIAGSEAAQALALATLLSSALDHCHAQGAGPCPVCRRSGALDERWRDQTEQEIIRLKTQAAQAEQAHAVPRRRSGKLASYSFLFRWC